MPTPTKRLDDVLTTLRKRPLKRSVQDRRPIYSAGLRALGWIQQNSFAAEAYWLFKKEDKVIRVWKGDAVEIAIAGSDFKYMPQKARRNIAIAGQ